MEDHQKKIDGFVSESIKNNYAIWPLHDVVSCFPTLAKQRDTLRRMEASPSTEEDAQRRRGTLHLQLLRDTHLEDFSERPQYDQLLKFYAEYCGFPESAHERIPEVLKPDGSKAQSLIIYGRKKEKPNSGVAHDDVVVAAITTFHPSKREMIIAMVAVREASFDESFCGNCDNLSFRRRGFMTCLIEIAWQFFHRQGYETSDAQYMMLIPNGPGMSPDGFIKYGFVQDKTNHFLDKIEQKALIVKDSSIYWFTSKFAATLLVFFFYGYAIFINTALENMFA